MKNQELWNAQKELLAHSYGHAQAYTTVVLLAGYAGFFAVWTFLKQDLSKGQVFSSGLLIALSLSSYIIWEIYQAFHRSQALLGLNKAVLDPKNFDTLLAEYKKTQQDRTIRLGRIWIFVFGFTVLTGFSAVSILIYAFIDTLWRMYVA
jgi:hypothetical protein